MYSLGIEIGSITAKAVILDVENYSIVGSNLMPSGYNTKDTAKKLVSDLLSQVDLSLDDISYTISTGYSRKNVDFSTQQVTEITCQAKGIYFLFFSQRLEQLLTLEGKILRPLRLIVKVI